MNTEIDTLSKIKITALSLFNKKGYFATTTRDIASEVGIKSSTLYFYFKSKEDIFFTLYREAIELLDKKQHNCLKEDSDEDIKKQLYTLFCISMEFFIENNQYSKLLFRYFIYQAYGIQDKIQTELKDWKDSASAYVQNLFNKGIQHKLFRNLSVDALVKTFYRNLNGYVYELIVYDRIPSKEEIDEVWQVYWDGIKA
jgi:Transcriptional regulator